jgi:tetratricopeptide (TPR) repeat protein
MMLGMANCLKADNNTALQNFNSVLQMDKDDSLANQNITYLKAHMEVCRLKKEGDINFSEGNIDEAKGNYTSALTIDSRHVQCIMNRAACRLASREYADCIIDCTVGLEIISSRGKQKSHSSTCALATVLSPTASMKRKWQAILLCRRAAAKQLSEDLDGALDDLKQAKNIVRNNDGIDVKSIDNDIIELKAKLKSPESAP